MSGLAAGAAAPPKSTAAKSMVRYRGRVFPGEPSSAGASASFVTCEARCEDDPHCVAFSVVKESRICRQFARPGEYNEGQRLRQRRQAAGRTVGFEGFKRKVLFIGGSVLDTVRSFGSPLERAGCCLWRVNWLITCRRWIGGSMCWPAIGKISRYWPSSAGLVSWPLSCAI